MYDDIIRALRQTHAEAIARHRKAADAVAQADSKMRQSALQEARGIDSPAHVELALENLETAIFELQRSVAVYRSARLGMTLIRRLQEGVKP